jgi:hypothetical protein
MMACFLADKTINLHDLANNGLLQLDQIRSYHAISIFSNHSSDDNNDKKKENEEDFLDEIDASSRRSSSKSHEQHSISKRLTDTTISNKQLIKNSLNDHHRKSSLSFDTTSEIKDKKISVSVQRRRQTVADSSTSSRLPNQTSIKKNSKCKNI